MLTTLPQHPPIALRYADATLPLAVAAHSARYKHLPTYLLFTYRFPGLPPPTRRDYNNTTYTTATQRGGCLEPYQPSPPAPQPPTTPLNCSVLVQQPPPVATCLLAFRTTLCLTLRRWFGRRFALFPVQQVVSSALHATTLPRVPRLMLLPLYMAYRYRSFIVVGLDVTGWT